jgi:hypothetical protein
MGLIETVPTLATSISHRWTAEIGSLRSRCMSPPLLSDAAFLRQLVGEERRERRRLTPDLVSARSEIERMDETFRRERIGIDDLCA